MRVGVTDTELSRMLTSVQQEAVAVRTGLQRYCFAPWQVSCVLIGAPHASAFLSLWPKPSITMLSCCHCSKLSLPQLSDAVLSSVTGMFTIISSLAIIEKVSPAKAEKLVRWFDPAILWIQRWLGALYVPALAVLPLTIQGIEGGSIRKAR